MSTCKSCDGKVLRTDAFCGTCGAPVPGAKPVVPIARETSGTQRAVERPIGVFSPPSAVATSARAVAIVGVPEPEAMEPPVDAVHRTAIRERQPQSEPAPVLPLHRKKNGAKSESSDAAMAPDPQPGPLRNSANDRDTSLPNIPIPPGPPILASDLLREQMRPSSPGEKALRLTAIVLSTAGAIGVLFVGGIHPLTLVSLALLLTTATLALTPMSYGGRAISLFLMGATATGVALWQQTLHGIATEGVFLAGGTILLSGSLLFRAYYRGAQLARLAVTFGVLSLGAWFFLSGGHEGLVTLDGSWQSWAPAITHLTFGLLALLALMAFMDSSTRGGSHVWAAALLTLYALHIGLLVARELWPLSTAQMSFEGPTIAAVLAGIVGTIVAGMALAQVFVVAYQSASERFKLKERISIAP